MNDLLAKKFSEIEEVRGFFLKILNESTEEQKYFKPAGDAWSIAQVIEHLVIVEKMSFQFMKKFDFDRKSQKLGFKSKVRFILLKSFFSLPLKIKIPTELVRPKGNVLSETLIGQWENIRCDMKAYLEIFPEDKSHYFIFKHPLAGKMNIFKTLDFFRLHMLHHKKQIFRIMESEGFPSDVKANN